MMLYNERAELILQQLQLQSTKRMQSRSIPGRRPVSRIIWRKYDRKKDVFDRAHPFFCSFYYLILLSYPFLSAVRLQNRPVYTIVGFGSGGSRRVVFVMAVAISHPSGS